MCQGEGDSHTSTSRGLFSAPFSAINMPHYCSLEPRLALLIEFPVAAQCTRRHSALCQFYERAHRGACRHRAGRNVRRVIGVDGRKLVHIVDLVRRMWGGMGGRVDIGVGVWAWAWCMGAWCYWGAWVWVGLTMMPPLSCMPRTVGLARQCSACNVAPFRRWKPATGSSAWRGLGLGLGAERLGPLQSFGFGLCFGTGLEFGRGALRRDRHPIRTGAPAVASYRVRGSARTASASPPAPPPPPPPPLLSSPLLSSQQPPPLRFHL